MGSSPIPTTGWPRCSAGTPAPVIVVGLTVLAVRGLRARRAVDVALHIGSGVRLPRRTIGRTVGTVLWPFPVRPRRVVRIPDVGYGSGGREHRLDVCHDRAASPGARVLIYPHGGGYVGGDKRRGARALLLHFAAAGWVCVSANHGLCPQAGFPDHLVDAKRIVGWARNHSHRYGGDADFLVVSGGSAART